MHQLSGNLLTAKVHADAMCLNHSGMVVDVDDKSGQMVALAVYQTIGVGERRVGQSDGLAHVQCRLQTRSPERPVNLHITERKDTDGNRAFLIVPYGNKVARRGDHTHHIALADILIDMLDGT